MLYKRYKYQINIIALAGVISIASYIVVLNLLDSMIANYDIYSFARQVSRDPQSIGRRRDRLADELAAKKKLLDAALARKVFTQDAFRELAKGHDCRLVQLTNRTEVGLKQAIYETAFSGTVGKLLELLHDLERGYHVNVTQALLRPDNESGSRVRMTVVLTVGADGFK